MTTMITHGPYGPMFDHDSRYTSLILSTTPTYTDMLAGGGGKRSGCTFHADGNSVGGVTGPWRRGLSGRGESLYCSRIYLPAGKRAQPGAALMVPGDS